ncbi:MAG: phosphoribosyl-AMP cyclohydrolase [Aestuariivirga sp.]|uniref:phosphoribosyl-AMP cyclohydrolase n=1 Tax=Aestuariivirga sp. TaxID=2650926 RepID=UPI0025BD61D6|nr:phosphoribosyl-AMP cyclohydrolase [Aestuariivirga sp.]MCA3560898.1 phosphoribosyl-AMP cyclohydrolase [Aestuariivirga sp.]
MSSDPDETGGFQPRFDSSGLITAVVSDVRDGTVLMVAHMNAEALRLTQETGIAHFWSRSRQALWRKGETSGETLKVTDILTDCDQDVLLLKAIPEGKGAACHTGRRSCFYRRVDGDALVLIDAQRLFDPGDVY